jgi:hypothetical protein
VTTVAWPTAALYLDVNSAPLSAADFAANVTNLAQRPDISPYLMSWSTTQGRSNIQSYFDAGTISVTLDNQTGIFDPTFASAPWGGNLGVGNHLTLVVTPSGGSQSAVFSGYVDSLTPSYEPGYEQMVITATDMFKFLNLQTWIPASPVAAQTSQARCQQILSDCGFSTSWLTVAVPTPTSICHAIPVNPDTGLMDHNEPALGAMQAAVHDTEDGILYVQGNGTLEIAGRYSRSNAAAPTNVFGDLVTSSTEIPYESDIAPTNDDALLINGMTVTADIDGTDHVYSDTASIAKYGPHYNSATSLTTDPNEAYDEAVYRVTINKTMATRIDQITVNPVTTANPGDFAVLLPSGGWRFETAVCTVKRRPPSGNVLSQDCFVEHVSHSFDGESWSSQLGLSNYTIISNTTNWLVLGTGKLGDNNTATAANLGR